MPDLVHRTTVQYLYVCTIKRLYCVRCVQLIRLLRLRQKYLILYYCLLSSSGFFIYFLFNNLVLVSEQHFILYIM